MTTKKEIENILIKSIIYPQFKDEINKDPSSNIYKFFYNLSGWAGFNIIENINYYLKNWGDWKKNNQECKLMQKIINEYNNRNKLNEEFERFILFAYAIKNNNRILIKFLENKNLNDEFSLNNIQKIVKGNALPQNIDINIIKNDDNIQKLTSDETGIIVLKSMIDYLELKKEKKLEEEKKETKTTQDIKTQKKDDDITKLVIDFFTELNDKLKENDQSQENQIINQAIYWWANQIIKPNNITNTNNEFLNSFINGGILSYSNNKKEILQKIINFLKILEQKIRNEINNKGDCILLVDYYPDPFGILQEAANEAELEFNLGDLPNKIHMRITKSEILVNGETLPSFTDERQKKKK